MMPEISGWTLDDANKAIANAIEASVGQKGFARNRAFVEDLDHWQDGTGWVGPGASTTDTEMKKLVLAAVAQQFVAVDVLSECLDRCANALMQREPDVALEPLEPAEPGSDGEGQQKEEAERLRREIAAWWDQKKLWEKARMAVKRSRYATRGALRLMIPPGNLSKGRPRGGLDFTEALQLINIEAPTPDAVLTFTDPDTQQRVAIVSYRDAEDKPEAEIWTVDGEDAVVRVVREEGEGETYRIRMGGRLPVNEMAAGLLITDPVRRQQDRLNFFETLLVRVGETAGFPERYTINAQPHGIWLTTPPALGTPVLERREISGTTWYLHAAPRTLGAAITTDLRGIVVGKETDGATQKIATPSVTFKDPTDPEYAVKASRHARRTIVQSCKQGHVALEGTAEASGTAYEQARADFEADLTGVKSPLEGLLRDTIEAAIAMAESMGSERVLDRYRCVVNLHVHSGPVTPPQRQQNNADVSAGTLSRESGMSRNGVEDVQSEVDRMRSDPDAAIGFRTRQIDAIQKLVAEGWTNERAARFLGIDEPEILALCREQDREAATVRTQEDAQDDEIALALAEVDGDEAVAA